MQSQGHPLGEIIAMELAINNAENQAETEARLRPRIQGAYPDWGKDYFSNSNNLGRIYRIKFRKKDLSSLSMAWSKGCVESINVTINLHEPLDALLEEFEIILNSNYARLLSSLEITIWLDPTERDDEQLPQILKSLDVLFAEFLAILTRTGAGTNLMQLKLDTQGDTARITEVDIAPLVSYFPNLRKLDVRGELGISKLKNRSLKELKLSTADISPEWQNILSAPNMQKLKRFALKAGHSYEDVVGNLNFLLENKAFQHLSDLEIAFQSFNQDCLKTFSKLSLPKLKRLTIELESDFTKPSHWNLFQPFFQEAALPSLTHLDLTFMGYDSNVISELLSSPLLPRLTKLAVSPHDGYAESFQPFLKHPESFQHLKVLEIYPLLNNDEMKRKLRDVFGKKVSLNRY